ncbi:MAG: EamA family transporter RarD [Gemmobacter sp.]|jgi:chloramphenicol-sensitive protein RarD
MTPQTDDSPRGLAFAVSAYVLWGFMPLYLSTLAHVSPAEIITHRILWSIPVAAVVLIATGRTADLGRALRSPRTLGMAGVTALLVAANWGIYVWAVTTGRALDAALGYYINPLFSIALGALLLGERLATLQRVAVGLAAVAVAVLTIASGQVPVAALAMTLTWGAYAYFKKRLPIGPNQGFLLEVLLLAPFALAALLWFEGTGRGHLWTGEAWLLLGLGPVTAIPLILYGNGAKLLRLSTIAILQYIAPTMILITAVFWFGEDFDTPRRIAFGLIWLALGLYSASLWRGRGAFTAP